MPLVTAHELTDADLIKLQDSISAILAKRQSPVARRGQPVPERRLYSVRETCQICNMSPATFWRRVREFELRKIGRRTLVTDESVERFLYSLPKVG